MNLYIHTFPVYHWGIYIYHLLSISHLYFLSLNYLILPSTHLLIYVFYSISSSIICQSLYIFISHIPIIFYICIYLIHPSIRPSNLSICYINVYNFCTWPSMPCEATHEPTLMTPTLVHGLLPWWESWLPGMPISCTCTWLLSLMAHVQWWYIGDLSLRAQCFQNISLGLGSFFVFCFWLPPCLKGWASLLSSTACCGVAHTCVTQLDCLAPFCLPHWNPSTSWMIFKFEYVNALSCCCKAAWVWTSVSVTCSRQKHTRQFHHSATLHLFNLPLRLDFQASLWFCLFRMLYNWTQIVCS